MDRQFDYTQKILQPHVRDYARAAHGLLGKPAQRPELSGRTICDMRKSEDAATLAVTSGQYSDDDDLQVVLIRLRIVRGLIDGYQPAR